LYSVRQAAQHRSIQLFAIASQSEDVTTGSTRPAQIRFAMSNPAEVMKVVIRSA
jgi:hypothetical protein